MKKAWKDVCGFYTTIIPDKWYSIKKSDWRKFINYLYKFGRKNPIEEAGEIKDKHEIDCWRAYYMAKNHGKNNYGLFELPWEWRKFILDL